MSKINPADLTSEQMEGLIAKTYSSNRGLYLGPFLMGTFIDTIFCGILIVQYIRFTTTGRRDRLFTKIVVHFSMFLSVAFTIYAWVFAMRCFVYNFGIAYLPFADILWLQPFFLAAVLVAAACQIFYIERAYRLLGNSKILVVILAPFVLLELSGLLYGQVVTNSQGVKTLFDAHKFQPAIFMELSGQLAADVIITLSTAYGLWKSKTGWQGTDKMINKLLMFTVETQLPPALLICGFMIYYAGRSSLTMSTGLNLIMMKPCVMGLLALLNARHSIRRELNSEGSGDNNVYHLRTSSRHQQATVQVLTERSDRVEDGAESLKGMEVDAEVAQSEFSGDGHDLNGSRARLTTA